MRSRLGPVTPLTLLVALLAPGAVRAAYTPVPGKLLIVRSGKLVKFVSRPVLPIATPTPGGSADPTTVDAAFSVVDDSDHTRTFFADLPKAQWKGLGNPAGSTGYKYKGAGTPADPCRVVLAKEKVLKAVCRDNQLLEPPLGDAVAKLRLGTESFGARFASAIKNQPGLYKAKDAPECSPSPACCGGFGFHAFTTATASGDCGDTQHFTGDPLQFVPHPNLACSGLYFGGGGQSTELPLGFPAQEQTVTAITSCTGQSATLGPATSTDTTSVRNCSAPGCLFGPPIPFPNVTSPPVSVCVVFAVSGAVSGTLDCDSGAQTLDLPLDAQVFLTGDTETDPGGTIPGVQPCPLCSGGTCIGGPNDGLACVPASADGTTSHDCPPSPTVDIGTVPLAFALSSGTITWTATPATNDTEVEPNQSRVFAGFCRDADDTGCFRGDPHVLCPPAPPGAQKCWENGMAVGPACAGDYETCGQRTNGAFGPNGGGVKTITVLGQPQDGLLCGSTTGALASLFAIAPTFGPTVDAAADFPGPAAVAIPVVGRLCPSGDGCPLAGP
jgi:hypothetical protein